MPNSSKFAPVYPFDSHAEKDSEGYYVNLPFFTKISDENLLDIKIYDQYLFGKKDQLGRTNVSYISASKNLEEIRIKFIENS